MDYDFFKVLHPCKSVAHLVSWILNIYIYWKFGVGNIHINTLCIIVKFCFQTTKFWFQTDRRTNGQTR